MNNATKLMGAAEFAHGDNEMQVATQQDAFAAALCGSPPVRACLMSLLQAAPVVTMVSSHDGRVLYINDMGRRLLGIGRGESLDTRVRAEFYCKQAYARMCDVELPACLSRGIWRGESTLIGRDGNEISVSQVLVAHREPGTEAPLISSISWDIREHKRRERLLRHRATHDDLTGLPNRSLLLDRLTKALQSAERHQLLVGLLFIDLDRFKQLNDAFGHEAANALLRELSQRLRSAVRSEDTVARYGGDEFVLLVPGLAGRKGLKRVTKQLRNALDRPFVVGGRRIRLSASVGVAIYPNDGCDADALMQRADASMYSVKGETDSHAANGRTVRFARLATKLKSQADFFACNERDLGMT